jgi:hypothetical protein
MMNDKEVEVGQVVYLNSGSPEMTIVIVDEVKGKTMVSVVWSTPTEICQAGPIPPSCITTHKPKFTT